MHVIIGIAVVVGLVAFAFGEFAARVLTALLLGFGAALMLFIIFIAAVDIERQSIQPQTVRMESGR